MTIKELYETARNALPYSPAHVTLTLWDDGTAQLSVVHMYGPLNARRKKFKMGEGKGVALLKSLVECPEMDEPVFSKEW